MIEGKRVVLIDDSIVRGTTSLKIVQMIRDAGAKEVHIRVASPMIFYPDYYGIDTPDRDNLLANQYDNLEAMCQLSSARTRWSSCRSTGSTRRWAARSATTSPPQFTDHYFTGDYPTTLTDLSGRGKSDPKTLSLMREAS